MKNVPNFITCLNLLSGCFACVMALKFNHYMGAFIFIALAAVFDFMDGMSARLLQAYSKLGAELDSLADIISFGLAPGCIVYAYLASYMGENGVPLIAFLLPVFAAFRLAKFNVDTRQSLSFLGLPVPATGLFWSSLIPSIHFFSASFSLAVLVGIVVLVVVFCLLMVSEIPMFSLKLKTLKWEDNQWAFSLIGTAVLLLVLFSCLKMPLLGVCTTIVVYIILSLVKSKMNIFYLKS